VKLPPPQPAVPLHHRLVQSWVVSGDSRVWWEAVVLCRKAGVVLLAVTLTNPYLQCVGATLWFAAAAVLQARYSPYTKRLFNGLEMASLVTTFLTAVVSTALLQYNVGVTSADLHPPESMTGIEWAVTVLLAVMNVGVFAVLAGLWLRLQCSRARGIVRRASLVTALHGRVAGMRASLAASRRRSGAAHPLSTFDVDGGAGGGDVVKDATTTASTLNPLRLRADAAVAAAASGAAVAAAPGMAQNDTARTTKAAATVMAAADAAPPDAPSVAASRRVTAAASSDGSNGGGTLTPAAANGVAFAATPIGRTRRH